MHTPVEVDETLKFLDELRMKGVALWCEGEGRLRYRAPRGVLSSAEIAHLIESREKIISILDREDVEKNSDQRDQCVSYALLSFSQLGHWNSYGLGRCAGIRHISVAFRVLGPLDMGILRESFDQIVCRHDALRTSIVPRNGVPMQEIRKSGTGALSIITLDAKGADNPSGVRELITEFLMRPIESSVGPLCEVLVIERRPDEHVLVIAMDHMISDGASLSIFIEELFLLYSKLIQGESPVLPTVEQYPDYAARQRATAKDWVAARMPFWEKQWLSYGRLRIVTRGDSWPLMAVGWSQVSIDIGAALRSELSAAARRLGTTAVLLVLVAYVAAIMRWCDVADVLIRYVNDGRDEAGIQRTIGFLASVVYLRVQVDGNENLRELLRRTIREYCRANANKDYGYIAAQIPRPEFTRNPAFNWIPQGSKGPGAVVDSATSLSISRVLFTHPMLRMLEQDEEPFVLFEDFGDKATGGLYFSQRSVSAETMIEFGRHFLGCLVDVIRRPEGSVRGKSSVMMPEPSGR